MKSIPITSQLDNKAAGFSRILLKKLLYSNKELMTAPNFTSLIVECNSMHLSRFTLEGIELKLFSDMDEVLSSPVRDLNHGLAKMTAGETTLQLDYFSDGSMEVKASLQSLLVEDIRPDPSVVIKR